MRPRALVFVALAVLVAAGGGVALAQGGSDPYELPEPKLRSAGVLALEDAAGCDRDGHVRIRFRPPAGAIFGWFSVRVGDREAARLTGVPRAASATVLLPPGRSRVRVEGETLGGQRLLLHRTYRRCDAPGTPAPAPRYGDQPVQNGGGED